MPNTSRILVVDDEPVVRQVVIRMLHMADDHYLVQQSEDGVKALQAFQQAPFDLVVVDLKMPNMNGQTLIKHIREQDSRCALIVLTGHAGLDTALELLAQYQISDFISKPMISPAQLLFSVKRALDKRDLLITLDNRVQELERLKDAAKEAKEVFISSMNHEFRTPMNAIIGFNNLLDSSEITDQQHSFIKQIKIGAKQMMALIEKIILAADVSADKTTYHFRNVSLVESIENISMKLEKLASTYEVNLNLHCEDALIWADDIHLGYVLRNLFENAILYNHRQGDVKINVQSTQTHTVKISIRDNGVGIAQDQHQQIYDMLNRQNHQHINISGCGVCLSTCKTIIEAMDGTIGFDSKPVQGSCFWFELPAGKLN